MKKKYIYILLPYKGGIWKGPCLIYGFFFFLNLWQEFSMIGFQTLRSKGRYAPKSSFSDVPHIVAFGLYGKK